MNGRRLAAMAFALLALEKSPGAGAADAAPDGAASRPVLHGCEKLEGQLGHTVADFLDLRLALARRGIRVIEPDPPPFPPDLAAHGVEGGAVVVAWIGADGALPAADGSVPAAGVEVERAVGDPLFARLALEHVRHTRFKIGPTVPRDGFPVRYTRTLAFCLGG